MSQRKLPAATAAAKNAEDFELLFNEVSFGTAGRVTNRREAFQKSKRAASTRITPPQTLPPRVLELPSKSFRYVSKRHLLDDVLPDFDDTESSDISCLEDDFEFEQIEVADGVFMRLRGSQETEVAWDRGECIETLCFVCDIRLACVRDCDCVICPQCRLVSPVDYIPPAAGYRQPRVGGVGLGIIL